MSPGPLAESSLSPKGLGAPELLRASEPASSGLGSRARPAGLSTAAELSSATATNAPANPAALGAPISSCHLQERKTGSLVWAAAGRAPAANPVRIRTSRRGLTAGLPRG